MFSKQQEYLRENGFLVLEDAFSDDLIADIRAEAVRICRGELGEVEGLPEVGPGDSDEDVIARVLCIHHPHKISSKLLELMRLPAIIDVLTSCISPNIKCMQSMLFIKAAGKPGQDWHQDELYIPTRDRSLTGAWMALDDTTVENGCLWVIPGSHKRGILWPITEREDTPDFDCSHRAFDFPYTDEDAVPVPVKQGSIVFFNGYLLHRSLPNRAKSGFRRVLVNHYMSAESQLPWHPDDTVFQGMVDFRDIVMVAGSDPYAYRGIQDVHKAHVRPTGEGGCQWPSRDDETPAK